MLHVKSCNIKHNSESIFHYFASAVNSTTRVQNVIEKIFMLSVVNSSLQNVVYVPLYTFLKLLFGVERLGFISPIAWLISQTRRDSTCADSPDRDSGFTRSPQCP